MTLTPAGHALAGRTPAVLVGWDQTLRETKGAASREARVLRVGFMSSAANEATQQIIAALLRLPFPGQDDVRIEVLLTEQISFDQLWDEPFVAAPAETGLWRDYHLATAERQGHPVRIVYVTDQPDAYLTAIANGAGIALVPESAARYYARPGITYRPVTGVSPSQVGVAWPPASDTDPVVQDFVRCCLDHKPTPHLENQPERIP